MKVFVYYIARTYSNGRTKLEAGPYFSHMDALIGKEESVFPVFDRDYFIAKTELEIEIE